ncbi:YolD-like family protein [Paenibacillus provencensis]|uniref:YolD-like family protein n=1 Tax=Paenibacillus provencensis TaxID=441151 RepID=A0ABW3PRZ2_9BACL|nr:YolD-like family protein [Paenibacillus sp. MER 78]MCM3129036.1 YolD-like family protein [Paenibacillus sp. MER 78]
MMFSLTAAPKPSAKNQKESRPKRDDFELEELAVKLQEAREDKKTLTLFVWKKEEPIIGMIEKLDGGTKLVHINEKFGGPMRVPFIDILKVADPESF